MAKLPAKVKEQLDDMQQNQVPHLVYVIKALRNNDPSLAAHLRDKPIAYYHGLLDGVYMTIESFLHGYEVYKGFRDITDVHRYYFID